MNNTFLQKAQKIWDKQYSANELKEDVLKLEMHKQLLNTFHVGPFYYYIFDLISSQLKYVSPEIKNVLGYNTDEVNLGFLLSKIHPTDQNIFLNHENTVTDFFSKLPIEKVLKYKVSYDYRILNKNGVYVRLLQQIVVLQHDDDGRILATLGIHTDISHLKTDNESKLSFIGLDGEPSFYNVEVKEQYLPSKEFFSRREKEILQELMNGANSPEIAEKLFISRYTVDTHRKNILAKTGTKNTAELINKVVTEALI